jgi:uncharacterized membrane protein YkoI
MNESTNDKQSNSSDTKAGHGAKLRLAAVVVGVGTVGFAVPAFGAVTGDDGNEVERPITGSALERASAVALDHIGQGRVTETEIEDEDSYYEVEVTLEDGRQFDVQLDENFVVVGDSEDVETDDD